MRKAVYRTAHRCARLGLTALCVLALCWTVPAVADGGVVYTDITSNPANGLAFVRHGSPHREAVLDAANAMSPIPFSDFLRVRAEETPNKAHGTPGTVIFDFDGDGDLDFYVTNGPDHDNSLFKSQLVETGALTFVDVAASAGVAAHSQESSGVCAGDIDNDGDMDLSVLGVGGPNLLFENRGDGTFADVTAAAGLAGDGRHPVACNFGDVDNDGLLDLYVANTYDDWDHRIPVFVTGPHYGGLEHNQLFRNQGGGVFTDVSASSGIENVSNMSGPGLTGGAFTWATTMVDYDLDGDLDIFNADNQGANPTQYSEERGWIRLYENDGTGHFTDVTISAGLDKFGGWMGVDSGDLNCDGSLDVFVTNLGYLGAGQPSQWFFGSPSGAFTNPGLGDLGMTPFGWGTSMIDYDNDGDSDILYHGGTDIFSIISAENPGVILTNLGDCSGEFDWDQGALQRDHVVRQVESVATGDLNGDGFEDVVTVSDEDIERGFFLLFTGTFNPPFGSPFDAVSGLEASFSSRINPGFFTYTNPTVKNGTLGVELSSADNGNGWAEITLVGGVGAVGGATVNRSGIGGVVFFTPAGGKTSIRPIAGGSSYGSQDSLAANFGLGQAASGTAEVLWPGGVRNRLYDVAAGERITFPEIPCSYDGNWGNRGNYVSCVTHALNDAGQAGLIDANTKARFLQSAKRAFDEAQ